MAKLARIAFAFLVLAMLVGFFNPLYTDEIVYRMLYARYFADHGQMYLLFPQCVTPDWSFPTSGLSAPYEVVESWLYAWSGSPLIIRAVSILLGFFFVGLFDRTAKALVGSDARLARGITLPLFGIGVAPFLFVMNRPDLTLAIAITGIASLALYSRRTLVPPAHGLGVFFLLTLLAFASHPNALFFTPLFIFTGLHLARGIGGRTLAVTVVLTFTLDRLGVEQLFVGCPENAGVRELFASYVVSPGLLFLDPTLFLRQIFANLLRAPEYLSSLRFRMEYPFTWIPSTSVGVFHSLVNLLIGLFGIIWLAAVIIGIFSVVRDAIRTRGIPFKFQLSGWLLLGALAIIAFQNQKNWYSSIIVLPSFGLVVAGLSEYCPNPLKRLIRHAPYAVILSLIVLLATFAKPALQDWIRPEGGERVQLSVSGFGYPEESRKIWTAAASCGFTPAGHYHHLMVDDLTYWTFRASEAPIHAFYLNQPIYHRGIPSLEGFLRERNSDGIITRCSQISDPTLLQKTIRTGAYCCLNLKGSGPDREKK